MRLINDQYHLSASDLVNFLGCKHLTELDREVALGLRHKPEWNDPALAILQKKGQQHETKYLEYLKQSGQTVMDLTDKPFDAIGLAMAKGYDIIYQPTLQNSKWMGRADFLIKIQGQSKFGDYLYEVIDTKLSQETKAGTVVQLCLYSHLLGHLQHAIPNKMHVVKPGPQFPTDSYNYHDFQAYFSLVKTKLETCIDSEPKKTEALPVSKCNTCRWWKHCDQQWHDQDYLTLVAGLRTAHLEELRQQGIDTLEQYAVEENPLRKRPSKGSPVTYQKLHGQAKVQYRGRIEKRLVYDLLPVQPLRGLNRLPAPSRGNIYFDIEGDHFYEDGGLEYLLGIVYKEANGDLVYNKLWAMNRAEEKVAFSQFMSLILERWEAYPDFYIYHYAPYEPAAIKRLASRHAIYESEVDQLLRAERFVDLYAVIKESLQASVERYSLKDLELFTEYSRKISLPEASRSRRRVEAAIELGAMDNLSHQDYQCVEDYNEDDCRATEALHQWLDQIYQEQQQLGVSLSRPELSTGDASDKVDLLDSMAGKLHKALLKDLPEDPDDWDHEQHALWLLAHEVDYFRRELKSKWWEYFRLKELDVEEALEERYALALLRFEKELPKQPRERNPTHRYKFPEQEVALSEGDSVEEIQGDKIGNIRAISLEDGWIDIKKTGTAIDIHPTCIHIRDIIENTSLPNALHDFAQDVVDHGLTGDGSYLAGKHLLLKQAPLLHEGSLEHILKLSESVGEAAIQASKILDHSYLPIQGPPGTGKTHIGAQMIIELYLLDKRIGVTAVSHKVIRNLLDKVLQLAEERSIPIEVGHKVRDKSLQALDRLTEFTKNSQALSAIDDDLVIGGTTYFWTGVDAIESLDYLFVDEAGQMSLANVLAACRCTKNLILLGDPQQLEQPQQGAHPEGSDISALDHVLDGKPTMPAGKGLFLDTSWRLNPNLCTFTSEVYYENRLKAKNGLEVQQILGSTQFGRSGLFVVTVVHQGNQNRSQEEVSTIKMMVDDLIRKDVNWTDRMNNSFSLKPEDILIVAPYNAQVAALKQVMPDMRIGTVDKFQGQQAPVVIYSMTTSSPDEAPRGMNFLYNPNRLNVATSRAQCICILVASPKLFQPECHSIEQMKWANGLCRYREMAREVVV